MLKTTKIHKSPSLGHCAKAKTMAHRQFRHFAASAMCFSTSPIEKRGPSNSMFSLRRKGSNLSDREDREAN